MYTARWFEINKVELTDTFIDAGYSAKTFDRPDMTLLTQFIAKHHKDCDYLVVTEMDRFSRDAGEAISLIKKLQLKYCVQIVSVTEGITYDYRDSGSFFRTGLSFLLAEDDNIRRSNKINSGIYTAKAREGRFIGAKAPFGYITEGIGKERKLIINEAEAIIVKYIFQSYLKNVPIYMILAQAKDMGLKMTCKSPIHEIISNPIYSAQQNVKPWRTLPGGLFPANHTAIIDMITWQMAQKKLSGKEDKVLTMIREEFPLRGVLKCHCGITATGAPSKGRKKWYNYYKCKKSTGHLNIGTIKAHSQLRELLSYLSLPNYFVVAIEEKSKELLENAMKENKVLLTQFKAELIAVEKRITSVETKWIDEQMTFETYNKHFKDLTQQRIFLKSKIEQLSADDKEAYTLLYGNLKRLTDMVGLYESATVIQKQELIRMVFDSKLYYQSGSYRTPYIMNIFSHNLLILSEKKLLVLDEKVGSSTRTRLGGAEQSTIEHLEPFLKFISSIKVA
jgi:DNA invertase Pin-like site-specific DNA recombinase